MLDTQTGKAEGQAPEAPVPQAGPEDGQAPASVDELQKLVSELRKEAAKHRTTARDAEKKLEAEDAARKAAEAEEAKKRGEFQKLYETADQERQRLAGELEQARFDGVFEKELAKLKPRPDATGNIMKVFDRSGLKLKDGKIDGLDGRLAEFRKANAYFFEPDAPASGLRDYNPGNGAGASSVPITDKLRREAEDRGLPVQDWAEIQAKRQRERADRART